MKYYLILIFMVFTNAEIVKMDDGNCYEKKGKMNFIVPCPVEKKQQPKNDTGGMQPNQNSGKCTFRVGTYEIEYVKPEKGEGVSCVDAQNYIHSVNLNYDKSLKKNKKNIGKLIVKRALSKCNVDIYYGDFITIGLMSGDRLMCDDLMADFSTGR